MRSLGYLCQTELALSRASAPDGRLGGALAACSRNVVKMSTRCCRQRRHRRCATVPISSSREASSQAGLVASGQPGVLLAGRRGTAPRPPASPSMGAAATTGWVCTGCVTSRSSRQHMRSLQRAAAAHACQEAHAWGACSCERVQVQAPVTTAMAAVAVAAAVAAGGV